MHLNLKYAAECVHKLLAPVVLCVLFVVASIESSHFAIKKNALPFFAHSAASGAVLSNALINSILLLSFIILATIFLMLLYLKRCYKFLNCWLIFATFLMLFVLNYFYFDTLLRAHNVPMDQPTALLIIWNFGVAGMFAVHWSAPLRLQQGYLIFVAGLMALLFIKHLSEWTTWFALAAISVWDLVAVLTNKGPLRILVETAQQRNEQPLPALIYSSTVVYMYMTFEAPNSSASTDDSVCQTAESVPLRSLKRRRNGTKVDLTAQLTSTQENNIQSLSQLSETAIRNSQIELQSPPDIKLGLGDFIFYAVLVGKVSVFGDVSTTIACLVAILFGLFLTCLLLTICQKALPALPISIVLGLFSYFASKSFVEPFMANVSAKSILI